MAQTLQQDNVTETFPEGLSMQHIVNEDLMFRRHQRLRKLPELTYEFTEDPALLQQYYTLRSIYLSKVLPVPMSPEPDKYDKRAEILVIRQNRQVVGGIRLIFRRNENDPYLYIERGGWHLPEILPELELKNFGYCEFSKLFILEEFQQGEVTKKLYQCLVDRLNQYGVRYGFATSSPAAGRIHRRSLRGSNAKYFLLSHISIPTEGPEREDNPSFQVLNMLDTQLSPTPQIIDLLKQIKHRPVETEKDLVN